MHPIKAFNFCSTDMQSGSASASRPFQPSESNSLSTLPATLDEEVFFYHTSTFAPSTSRTYSAHQMGYLDFCRQINIPPVPISQVDLSRYIAYFSRRLSFNSVRQ